MPTRAEEIAKLIQKIASEVTVAEPKDASELENINSLVSELKTQITSSEGLNEQILTEVTKHVNSASESLASIISETSSNSKKSLDSVTQDVCALQKLIDDAMTPAAPEPKTEQAGGSERGVISEEDAPLVQDFVTESQEHIETAEASLLAIEQGTSDGETINKIFRAFHTVKGMAGFLNLNQIGKLAHSAESLLDRARKGTLELKGQNLEVVFISVDTLKKMILQLKECLETHTPIPDADNSVLFAQIQSCIEGKAQVVEQKIESQTPIAIPEQVPASAVQEKEGGQSAAAKNTSTDEKIKVSTSKLDVLINMIGELVIAQSMVNQQIRASFPPEHDLCRKTGHQGKIVRELQEISMSLRMVPIQGLFQKMARLVRDLSHKSGKQIDFKISGEETEIDRNIVEMLSDPLVHMLRNSVDHGIEPAEKRQQAGKNAVGQVELRAFHHSGNIVIEIVDDGAGLNKDKIIKKAIDAGIVSPGQELSEQEIFKLIFHAGLSTAEKVTDISGRGVGMDVVRKNIESLRGKIEITSELGKGTTFTIRLPLTLAIIDGQIVSVANHKYVIPITSIEHSLRPSKEQVSTVQGKGELVNIRGTLLPLLRLYDKFHIENAITDPTRSSLVVVEGDNKKCCVMVDEILGQQQVVIKSLGEGIGFVKGISGAAIMGDGSISLIVDAPGLMEHLGTRSGA